MSRGRSTLPPVPPDALLLSVRETAALIGRSENIVWAMLKTGQLTRIKAGNSTKVARSEVEALVRQWQTAAEIARLRLRRIRQPELAKGATGACGGSYPPPRSASPPVSSRQPRRHR
jgi:hypothetical protein